MKIPTTLSPDDYFFAFSRRLGDDLRALEVVAPDVQFVDLRRLIVGTIAKTGKVIEATFQPYPETSGPKLIGSGTALARFWIEATLESKGDKKIYIFANMITGSPAGKQAKTLQLCRAETVYKEIFVFRDNGVTAPIQYQVQN